MINSLDGLEPGQLFTTRDGRDVWAIQSMCSEPTITLKNLHNGRLLGGAVGCPNVKDFVPLVPATELSVEKGEGKK